MRTHIQAARVAVASVLVLALAGCGDTADGEEAKANGIAEMRPAAAVALAAKTLADHDSVTFTGTMAVHGKSLPTTLVMLSHGACEATSTSDKGRLTVRIIGRTGYLQANAKALIELMDVPAERAAQLADTWLSYPLAKRDIDDCKLGQLLPTGPHRARMRNAGTKEVDGRQARGFRGRDEDGPMTVWIATTGEPDVLLVTSRGPDGAASMGLEALDDGVDVTAPPTSRPVG